MGFFVQHNCKVKIFILFFIVLKFCEAEAINMCREIKLQKKKTYIKLRFQNIHADYLALVNGAFQALSPGCDVTRVQYSISI